MSVSFAYYHIADGDLNTLQSESGLENCGLRGIKDEGYWRSAGVNGADLRDILKMLHLSPKVPYFRMSGETNNRTFSLTTD